MVMWSWFPEKLKHISRLEIVVICLVLASVILAWTADSVLHPAVTSTDLNMSATIITKNMTPTLYPRDNLFSDDTLYRFYTPAYLWLVAQAWQWGGSFEAGLIWLVPPILMLYLVGMFILAWSVIDNKWVALGLTIASAHYHLTMGSGFWGVGGSSEMMPRTLFMPIIPLIMVLFLGLLENPRWRTGILVGLTLGLAANLHPVSGFHFVAILSGWLIVMWGHCYKGWQTLIAIGISAVIGAWPVTSNYLSNSGEMIGDDVTFATFSRIVTERYPIPFYPGIVKWPLLGLEFGRPILDNLVWFYLAVAILFFGLYVWHHYRPFWPNLVRWSWFSGGLITLAYAYLIVLFDTTFIFLAVGLYLVYRFWQDSWNKLDHWLIVLMGVVVLYSFVGYYLLALIWQRFEVWPLTSLLIEYARAARFVYLPIYLLAGLAGATLVNELTQRLGKLIKFGCDPQIAFAWVVAIIFALLPGLSRYAVDHNFATALLLIIVFGVLALAIAFVLTRIKPLWGASLSIILLGVILFGPLAPVPADYLSVPARNFLDKDNWRADAISNETDTALYEWTLQHTAPTALFYGCFGPETMTYFRRKAQRSISHNWKDLAYNVHNRATLIPAYHQFRDLEAACRTFDQAIAAAHSLKADYILASSSDAAEYLHQACFINEKYAVFSLNPAGCPSGQFRAKVDQ